MKFMKANHWVWNSDLGARGTAYLGTDFNTNRDLAWFEEHFPRALWHLFDEVQVVLLPSYNATAVANLDEHGLPMVMFNMQWLRETVEKGDFIAIEEVMVHERTHLIQMLEGRLEIDLHAGVIRWEGNDYISVEEVGIGEGKRYLDLPWEIEAFEAQALYLQLKGRFGTKEEAYQALCHTTYLQGVANAA